MYPAGKNKAREKFIDLNIDHVNNGAVLSVLERILPAVLPPTSDANDDDDDADHGDL